MTGCRPLTDDEIARAQRFLHRPRDRVLFALGLRTGFRVSELLSLRVADVWPDGRPAEWVTVRRQDTKGRTQGRSVPLHPLAGAQLARWLLVRQPAPDEPLFKSRKGGRLTRVQAWRILAGAFRRAGLSGRLGTHCMRKSFAAGVYERLGGDLMGCQEALGHANINSTAAYLRPSRRKVEAAILAG